MIVENDQVKTNVNDVIEKSVWFLSQLSECQSSPGVRVTCADVMVHADDSIKSVMTYNKLHLILITIIIKRVHGAR